MVWNLAVSVAVLLASGCVCFLGFLWGASAHRRWIIRELEKIELITVALIGSASDMDPRRVIDLLRDPGVSSAEFIARIQQKQSGKPH